MSISMARGRWVIVSRPFRFSAVDRRNPRPIGREYQIPRRGPILGNDVAGLWMPRDVEIRLGDLAVVLVFVFVVLFLFALVVFLFSV
jgi:hypothetical protein